MLSLQRWAFYPIGIFQELEQTEQTVYAHILDMDFFYIA